MGSTFYSVEPETSSLPSKMLVGPFDQVKAFLGKNPTSPRGEGISEADGLSTPTGTFFWVSNLSYGLLSCSPPRSRQLIPLNKLLSVSLDNPNRYAIFPEVPHLYVAFLLVEIFRTTEIFGKKPAHTDLFPQMKMLKCSSDGNRGE